MKTVYVVSYEIEDSCGGYDWFYKKEDAEDHFAEAKKNHLGFGLEETGFSAYHYEKQVSSYDTATDEIERASIEDCAAAFRAGNYCGAVTAYNRR